MYDNINIRIYQILNRLHRSPLLLPVELIGERVRWLSGGRARNKPSFADLMEAPASTPLLATPQPAGPIVHEQGPAWIAHARVVCMRAVMPLLLVCGSVLLTLAVLQWPGLIFLFLVLQPVFLPKLSLPPS